MSNKKPLKLSFLGLLALLFSGLAFGLDETRYIPIDQVKRGMDAYCLTVLAGSEPKKHPLKVVSVVRNMQPGQDRILVMGTDEAFRHVGPVQGCSGSPVYIDGRLAGALSAGWSFATDPLYAVTPIAEMLPAGQVHQATEKAKAKLAQSSLPIDFSKPLDLTAVRKAVLPLLAETQNTEGNFTSLPCPLITSFSPQICKSIAADLKPAGLVPLSGGGAGISDESAEDSKFVPGGVLSIPLLSGDIAISAVGTVTEVIDDEVYGFGHSFRGQGAVDLPMAAGQVHTVVSSMQISFKLATAGKITGAFRADTASAVFGKVGEKARLIPLRIKISRFDAPEDRVFNCKLAYHQLYTPAILQAALTGVVQMQGSLPQEHTIEYKGSIGVKGYDPVKIKNISSGSNVSDVVGEAFGAVALFMDNSFGEIQIKSLDFEINIKPGNILANISSVQLDDVKVKPADKIGATVILQSPKSEKTAYRLEMKLPKDIKPGSYKVMVVGEDEYGNFIRKAQPHKFMARDADSLVAAIKHILSAKRNRMYMVIQLPSDDVVIEGKELVSLPGSKTMLLSNPARTITAQPIGDWIETSAEIPSILVGGKVMQITVER